VYTLIVVVLGVLPDGVVEVFSRLLQNHGFAWDDGFVTSWHEDGWDV